MNEYLERLDKSYKELQYLTKLCGREKALSFYDENDNPLFRTFGEIIGERRSLVIGTLIAVIFLVFFTKVLSVVMK